MKSWMLLIVLVAAPVVAHDHAHAPPPAAKAVQSSAAGKTYGAPMPADAGAISIAAAAGADAGAPRAFHGRITEVCQQQGCWMVLEDEGVTARVFMSGHGFSVPKDAVGKAVVYGTLTLKTLDAEAIKHLSAESRTPVAAQELTIDATSVHIDNG